MELDDLDRRLLAHFSRRFPKPSTLDYCAFDAKHEEIMQLCNSTELYLQTDLLRSFVSNNRWGLIGDWKDFPAFVGDLTVLSSRHSLDCEHDHAFFFLHLSPHGDFDAADRALLKEWINRFLSPVSQRHKSRTAHWGEHALDYLAIYAILGGELNFAVEQILEHRDWWLTGLKEFVDPDGHAMTEDIRRHFKELQNSTDNQRLPTTVFIDPSVIAAVVDTMMTYDGLLIA
ncbi:MAG: hypothetical protein P1V97_19000 [Planctomycetota bacterium]|nr:hypothetical protein [Planctomycetota bacterium]